MTFIRKFSGDRTAPIVACYTCPEHGEFDAEVRRDENGEAPDVIVCGDEVAIGETTHPLTGQPAIEYGRCEQQATWTPSPVAGRVRRIEAVKGGWEKPERSTFLDTRRLGEGQSMDEFRAERKRVWEEQRKRTVMELKRGY